MMRYQSIGVTPDPLPLPTATAAAASSSSHLRTCKEEGLNGSAKIPTFPASEPKPLLPRPAAVPSASRDQAFAHLPRSSPEPTAPAGGDVLLQWGRRKRSRGARSDSRAVNGEEAGGSGWRPPAKIQRRSISGMEKPPLAAAAASSAAAAATATGAGYSRGANLRACSSSRDYSSGFLLTRNAEDRPNGASRPEKRAPPSPPERLRRANGCSTHQADPMNKASTPSAAEQEVAGGSSLAAAAAAHGPSSGPAITGKLNLDRFEWPRIYLTLSRKEKEEDFYAMKGTKLPHRPKKRAKNVDKALQYCFPGMWLSDLTRGRYEVREKKCARKKRRGLKGLESMDSDSD